VWNYPRLVGFYLASGIVWFGKEDGLDPSPISKHLLSGVSLSLHFQGDASVHELPGSGMMNSVSVFRDWGPLR
jgi:hypothetical protein